MKLALIGAGQRGMIYAGYACRSGRTEIAAIADPNEEHRLSAARILNVPAEKTYSSAEELLGQGKIADALIIASMDRDHYRQTMAALELGYDILLEKPISPDPKEALAIQEKADARGLQVIVCHVLRYTNFFSTLKSIVDSGELGRIVSIQHNENVGNFHIAHSFVRGNWRNSAESSPIIMQKSCHDMDILAWLTGSEAKKIASFGSLTYFKEENAPEGSSGRCLTCRAAEGCRFNALKMYLPIRGNWPAVVLTPDQTEEGIRRALETSPYGRCVYRCDNDVCDHQVTLMEFKNGVTASFNLSGFTNRMSRTIKIMCENGEIRGDDKANVIEVTHFASNAIEEVRQTVIRPEVVTGGHGGGDALLMEDFLSMLQNGRREARSSIRQSIESHVMAYAAELSRTTGQVVDIDTLKERLRGSLQ